MVEDQHLASQVRIFLSDRRHLASSLSKNMLRFAPDEAAKFLILIQLTYSISHALAFERHYLGGIQAKTEKQQALSLPLC